MLDKEVAEPHLELEGKVVEPDHVVDLQKAYVINKMKEPVAFTRESNAKASVNLSTSSRAEVEAEGRSRGTGSRRRGGRGHRRLPQALREGTLLGCVSTTKSLARVEPPHQVLLVHNFVAKQSVVPGSGGVHVLQELVVHAGI